MATDPQRRRPTIDDVAAASGVSRGTVSRVLNGGHWVSPDAHAAVTAAIKEQGYRINPHARSLATSRTNSIAFLLTEPHDLLFEDPNFSMLMRGAASALAERDESLVLIMAGDPDEQRRALEFMAAGHVDGALLVSSHAGGRSFLAAITKLGIPVIASGIPLGLERKMGYVTADDAGGALRMVEYLRSTGRRRIATIAGPQDTSGGQQRLAGYREAVGDDFDPELVAFGDYGSLSGEKAMIELLGRRPDIDAVFAANDRMAAAAILVAQQRGRQVPDDIAVAGFDDSPAALLSTPRLTTMRQPFDRISKEMVRLLLDEIEGGGAASMVVPTELVRRESA